MATASLPAGRSVILSDIDWGTYTRLLYLFAERPSIRLTYDRGTLEIARPLADNELCNPLLRRYVATLTEELNLPIRGGGSTTLRRRRSQRGLDPDDCWWIALAPQMLGRGGLSLAKDPPPDLAADVQSTRCTLNRLKIYAALGVPEVWRLYDDTLTFHLLQQDGKYAQGPSRAFPGLTAAELLPFLKLHTSTDDNSANRQFRACVRQRIADGWK
jgi:Uma2 family endonuclease